MVGPTSWFWQCHGQPPPPHADALALRPVFEQLPLAFRRQPWSEEERRRLGEGVLQMVQVRPPPPDRCFVCGI
jgi:hypothetical protein